MECSPKTFKISLLLVIFFCVLAYETKFIEAQQQQQVQQNITQSAPTPNPNAGTTSSSVKKDLNLMNNNNTSTSNNSNTNKNNSSSNNSKNNNSNSTQNCVCDGALLGRVDENGKEIEICPQCKCKYENRNTTLIRVVVIIVIWIISILVIYMLFLICLDPLLNKRVKANYQEHTNEDDDTTSIGGPSTLAVSTNQEINSRANVLNRVGHQQDKWKRQVKEQRRNIYDRRTMLN